MSGISNRQLPQPALPLVSVIIPCYNHSEFLHRAIQSICLQSYKNVEIVLIDDGSTDATKSVVQGFKNVKYYYQSNAGLAAARNAGIEKSKGDFIVFLDADDWLLENALEINVNELIATPASAFVSGSYTEQRNSVSRRAEKNRVLQNHYLALLESNYIGMIATVIFRRSAFNHIRFDTSLKACEDYDVYLRIAREYPIAHHQEDIAVYYMHENNMSNNIPMMLENAIGVLNNQSNLIKTEQERSCQIRGKYLWTQYYCILIFEQFMISPLLRIPSLLRWLPVLARHNFLMILKIAPYRLLNAIKRRYRSLRKKMTGFFRGEKLKIDFGSFNRTSPLSTQFGYDRGGPVDRYYIEKFLAANDSHIAGKVLEVGDNGYTIQYGGCKVTASDILHIDSTNPKATIIGDLSDMPLVKDNIYDCIVLTQTLHLIYNCREAIATCFRILKPGGVLLLTVPGISQIDEGDWNEYWYWSFTKKAIDRMLQEHFRNHAIHSISYGNVYAAASFLYGAGLPEVDRMKLDSVDPHYQLIIGARAIKSI